HLKKTHEDFVPWLVNETEIKAKLDNAELQDHQIPIVTADISYARLVNIIGNVNLVAGGRVASGDLAGFLSGLQHSLIVFSVLILVSGVFSFLRGPRSDP